MCCSCRNCFLSFPGICLRVSRDRRGRETRRRHGDIKLVQRDNDRQTHNDWMEESFRLLVRERERVKKAVIISRLPAVRAGGCQEEEMENET